PWGSLFFDERGACLPLSVCGICARHTDERAPSHQPPASVAAPPPRRGGDAARGVSRPGAAGARLGLRAAPSLRPALVSLRPGRAAPGDGAERERAGTDPFAHPAG